MKRFSLVVFLYLCISSALVADEWYSIDGFFLITGESISIDTPSRAESEGIEFRFDDDLVPGVRGVLVEADNGTATYTNALHTVIRLVHGATLGQGEISQMKARQWQLPGKDARLFTVTTEGDDWLAAAIRLGVTPGGEYSHLALIALQPNDPDRLLERLLNSLEVELADAAG
jgi:hypothetical protein